jgi:hypothetical protein
VNTLHKGDGDDDDVDNNNKYCIQKKIASAVYVISLRRQQNILCQHAQYLQKNNTSTT